MSFDVAAIRKEFPILNQEINGEPLVYFDNAATSQKPITVINALKEYYEGYNANIHRGLHTLADKATAAFEETRVLMQKLINAAKKEEIIFTYGTTDSINLVANTFGKTFIKEGDEIIISTMEHHSNIVPWQMLCETNGCKLKIIPLDENGDLILEEYEKLLSKKTKLVSIVHVSNSLGTVNPVKKIIEKAHEYGAKVLLDGAQAISHFKIDVQALDVDFYVTSAHKFYGPTGMGILYGKSDLLNEMPPYRGGGEMIKEVSFEKTTYNEIPYKFEAGTPNIADVIAVKEAIVFLNKLDSKAVSAYENNLLKYAEEELQKIEGLKIIGTAKEKVSLVAFIIEGIHPQDIGHLLDQQGIAIRTGHHCTQPLMKSLGLDGTARASFALYNTKDEIDLLVKALIKIKKLLG